MARLASKPFEVGGEFAATEEGLVEILPALGTAAETVEVFADVCLATAQFNPSLDAIGNILKHKAGPLLTMSSTTRAR